MYYVYYQPTNVSEGNTDDRLLKFATIEEAFLETVQLKQEGNRDIKILKEVKAKVELTD